MIEIPIFFGDLTEKKQMEILRCLGIEDVKETGWDFFPLTTFVIGDD